MKPKVSILLADDDKEDRFIINDAFETNGLSDAIDFVEDGEQVLKYLEEVDDARMLPSLIVLDLNMPRLNGTQTLRALKRHFRYQDIPVIIFSTSVNEIEMEECMSIGAAAYFTKPVKFDECISMARKFYEFSQNSGVPIQG